jgi:hypothetical protein
MALLEIIVEVDDDRAGSGPRHNAEDVAAAIVSESLLEAWRARIIAASWMKP